MSSPANARSEREDLYNSAPCGFHSLDKDGVFVRVNETELRWLGYTQDELVGKKKIFDLLAPESIKSVKDAFTDFLHQVDCVILRCTCCARMVRCYPFK